MSDNMAIWDKVSVTDPNHTKRVTQRGGFTAIDAHYQIECATRQFGPVGEGWGYVSGDPIFQSDCVIIPLTLWHGTRENSFGPWYGCAKMTDQRLDPDAPKKAMTDAITKALSHLGFNADVFLGKFDDNKYVESLRQRTTAAEAAQNGLSDAWHDSVLDSLPDNPSPRQKADAFAQRIIADAQAKKGKKALDNLWASKTKYIQHFDKTYPDLHADVCEAFVKRQTEIESEAA